MANEAKATGYRVFWDYPWTAKEWLNGNRWFLERDRQFLRDTRGERVGFRYCDEAKEHLERLLAVTE